MDDYLDVYIFTHEKKLDIATKMLRSYNHLTTK